MKAIFLVLFSLTAFISNGQSSARWLKNGSVKLKYRPSPLFYLFNESATNKAGSPGWLMLSVRYDAANKKIGNKSLWLDDITMESEVILQGIYKSKAVTILLKGKTVFWSIPMDGKKHKALGCIPPQVIARFARKGNKIELSKIIARVTFYTSSRKILMRIHSSSNSKVKNYFSKLKGSISSGILTVEDIIMPRNKTPWGVFNYELYDVIKPDSPR
ncbi:MAG: hypothetical protein KOO69_05630 [Victivallales bacterium]|nr:hypothetical protein [Victivallales bacterium]